MPSFTKLVSLCCVARSRLERWKRNRKKALEAVTSACLQLERAGVAGHTVSLTVYLAHTEGEDYSPSVSFSVWSKSCFIHVFWSVLFSYSRQNVTTVGLYCSPLLLCTAPKENTLLRPLKYLTYPSHLSYPWILFWVFNTYFSQYSALHFAEQL